jgi:hypothetical protein
MDMNARSAATKWTRREALGMLGMGVAAAALPRGASAAPSFPEGAVIRTILKDYAPEELGGGATLFHEHLSGGGAAFLLRFRQFTAETQAVNRPPNVPPPARQVGVAPDSDLSFTRDLDLMSEEMAIAKREGIVCIVDAGNPDTGRDIGFLRRLSLRSGLPIVASGGFYTQPFYPREISTMSAIPGDHRVPCSIIPARPLSPPQLPCSGLSATDNLPRLGEDAYHERGIL